MDDKKWVLWNRGKKKFLCPSADPSSPALFDENKAKAWAQVCSGWNGNDYVAVPWNDQAKSIARGGES